MSSKKYLQGPESYRQFRETGPWAGLSLESPGNFSGPELNFKIKIHRMVVKLLACKPARLVSSTCNFTA